MSPARPIRFHRYVAIGDSSTEGLDDPDGLGHYRGWADRLAGHLAAAQGNLRYANLAIRGRRTRQVLDEQLGPALALDPDLVTVFTGTNDVVSRRFDRSGLQRDLEAIHGRLVTSGATVLTFTLPDLSPVMPLARLVRSRIAALNDTVRGVAAASGTILLDFAHVATTGDPRLWSGDRFHANPAGHARIASALAEALALPGSDSSWAAPLATPPPDGVGMAIRAEVRWFTAHLVPWALRHLRGRSSGDGVRAKRPTLEWVHPPRSGASPPGRNEGATSR